MRELQTVLLFVCLNFITVLALLSTKHEPAPTQFVRTRNFFRSRTWAIPPYKRSRISTIQSTHPGNPVTTQVPQDVSGTSSTGICTHLTADAFASTETNEQCHLMADQTPRTDVKQNSNTSSTRLCGYPAICDAGKCETLNITSDPLINCEIPGAAGVVGFVTIALGLILVLGNLLIPVIVWREKDMKIHYNYIKVSLAFSDMILGVILLGFVLPNMIWLRNSTESKILEAVIKTERNSWRAILCGGLFALAAQASVMHLLFLSVERFTAIKWPFWHRQRSTKTVQIILVGLWILSAIVSFLPATLLEIDWFGYNLIPVAYIYMLTLDYSSRDSAGFFVYIGVVNFLPFVAMVVISCITGFSVWRSLRSSSRQNVIKMKALKGKHERNQGRNKTDNRNTDLAAPLHDAEKLRLKPEVHVFITIVIMIFGFCLTLVPVSTVLLLYHVGYYDCTTYSVPYFAAFLATMSNGFINTIIYSVRDERFRKGVSSLFFPTRQSN